MKGDLLKTVYTTTLQTMNTIYKEKGAAGLFKGLPQRGPRAMIAVPLFGEYSTYLEKKLKENSKR